jgi:hypothetical protein
MAAEVGGRTALEAEGEAEDESRAVLRRGSPAPREPDASIGHADALRLYTKREGADLISNDLILNVLEYSY